MSHATLKALLGLAGLGQLILAIGSLTIPRVLRWSDDLAKVRPLTRQVFWTYAGYIWTTNVCFGLLSLLAPSALLAGGTLPAAVAGFIALYWFARIAIQFTYFDRSAAPPGRIYKIAEAALVGTFVGLTGIYSWACAVNLGAAAP